MNYKVYLSALLLAATMCVTKANATHVRSGEAMRFMRTSNETPYRLLASKDPQGWNLTMDDGATWRMDGASSANVVQQWRLNDPLVIYPTLFPAVQGARFYILNERLNTTAYAELSNGPLIGAPTNNRVVYVDYVYGEVILEDGAGRQTRWHVDITDLLHLQKWQLWQSVILGSNESCYAGWFFSAPYILINVENADKNAFVHATLL